MVSILKYELPDFSLLNEDKNSFCIWIPAETYIVLGASNNPEEALFIEHVINDKIKVFKRPSGGQSVVLTPRTIVVSVILINKSINPKIVFEKINSLIIESLESLGLMNLCHKGISDIAIGEKKILGSSIYRKKEKLFYHAVLNYSEDTGIFEKYLKHPVKEPDYRKGRTHKDFISSIFDGNNKITINEIVDILTINLKKIIWVE